MIEKALTVMPKPTSDLSNPLDPCAVPYAYTSTYLYVDMYIYIDIDIDIDTCTCMPCRKSKRCVIYVLECAITPRRFLDLIREKCWHLGLFPLTVTVTIRSNRNYNSPLIRPL